EAIDKIEELLGRNARLAQDRLDRLKLTALAADQKDLADRAKPNPKPPTNELAKEQRELLDRLLKLITESDPLRHGTEAAAGRETRQLATAIKDLAILLRDLDSAAKQLTADTRRTLTEGVT